MVIAPCKLSQRPAQFQADSASADKKSENMTTAAPQSTPTDSYSAGPDLWDPLGHPWGEETVRLTDNLLPTKRLRRTKLTSSRDRCEHLDTSSPDDETGQ